MMCGYLSGEYAPGLRLRRLLHVPVFEDEAITRVAGILHYVLLLLILGGLIYTVVVALFVPELSSRLPLAFMIDALMIGLLLVLHTGRVRLVALILTISMWLLLNIYALISGGMQHPVFAAHVLIIIIAGLTLGAGATLGFASFSAAAGIIIYWLEAQGMLPSSTITFTPVVGVISHLLIIVFSALLLGLAIRHIDLSLARAREVECALAKRNEALEREISERRKTEDALRQSEARLRLAYDTVTMGIWDWDIQANSITWDKHMYTIFGVTEAQRPPDYERFLELIHPDDRERLAQAVSDAIQQQKPLNTEFRIRQPDGTGRWVYELARLYYDDAGEVKGLLGVTQDISERKEAEAQRLELALERERVTLLREFISDMSHDLKNPLTVINTSLHLLEKLPDPDYQQQKIAAIKEQTQRLESMIQNILTLSRLEHLEQTLREPVDLNAIMTDIEHKLRPEAEKKGLRVVLDIDEALPLVAGNNTELYSMMMNLAENAVFYTPERGEIRLCTRHYNNTNIIEVVDTGMGIPPQELAHIFDRFYRSDRTRSVAMGSGLGLAIARRVVERHGGQIEVESEEGRGSLFRVRLPVERF